MLSGQPLLLHNPLTIANRVPTTVVSMSSKTSQSTTEAATQHHPSLARILPLEAACAILSAGMVAPLISIVDKSIFANASGKQPLAQGLVSGLTTLFRTPLHFLRQPSFLLIWGVYSGTYIVANTIQAVCDHRDIPWQFPKFIGSSVANVGLSVLKDLYFTRAFGTGPARPVPATSYSLYTLRDTMTIFASFNLPAILAARLEATGGMSLGTAETVAQLVAPCTIQLASTPLHLYAMDLYNRPGASALQRQRFVRHEYGVTTMARMARIFPAFGIGGVANKFLRKKGRDWLDSR
ncbi:hypothetical protein BSLG_009356 [Batrachochytrium salamandrivorans]|nr:hypothetical protein BSLG_009356 [Batrachochytrium salamandrivorans]